MRGREGKERGKKREDKQEEPLPDTQMASAPHRHSQERYTLGITERRGGRAEGREGKPGQRGSGPGRHKLRVL